MATVFQPPKVVSLEDLLGQKMNTAQREVFIEIFSPTISRVVEQSILAGCPDSKVIASAKLSAVAIVAGLRAAVKEAGSSCETDQPRSTTLTVQVPPSPQK